MVLPLPLAPSSATNSPARNVEVDAVEHGLDLGTARRTIATWTVRPGLVPRVLIGLLTLRDRHGIETRSSTRDQSRR